MVDALRESLIWLAVIGVFGFLVLVHEVGHFIVARRLGVRILRFSIGFGPKLWGSHRGETEYWISWIPLGGYVKMAGEQHSGEQAPQPGDYLSKTPAQRACIVFAGPAVNALIAWVVLWLFFLVGYPGVLPVVGEMTQGMPAEAAGIESGDRILSINGRSTRTWDQMTAMIHRSAGKSLEMRLKRGRDIVNVSIVPVAEEIKDTRGRSRTFGFIGIQAGVYRANPLEAIGLSLSTLGDWTVQTFQSLWALMTRQLSMRDTVTGPIGIVHLTSQAARLGLGPLLYLMSLFSLSLAIFNTFPIPVLDGGHLLFLTIEQLRGRPVSPKVQDRAALVSMVLLVSFVLLVSVQDVRRLWTAGNAVTSE